MTETAEVTIEGKVYNFQKLGLRDGASIQTKVIKAISALMGKSDLDEDLLFSIGEKLCKGLLVDDFEVNDIDEHFAGNLMLFNIVMMEGLKINFKDFFLKLEKLDSDSKIKNLLSDVGIEV